MSSKKMVESLIRAELKLPAEESQFLLANMEKLPIHLRSRLRGLVGSHQMVVSTIEHLVEMYNENYVDVHTTAKQWIDDNAEGQS
jgi:hypothetical protein